MIRANRKRWGSGSRWWKHFRPSLVTVGFLVGACSLTWWWVDAAGVSHYLQMTQELERLQGEIRDLEGANEGLREEISRINHDPFVIEKLARERLGFVKEGEIVYQLVDPQ